MKHTTNSSRGTNKKAKQSFTQSLREYGPLYVLALPGVIALIVFNYLSMLGTVLVFKDYNFKGGIFGSPWAQPLFKNFEFFFNNMDTALRATRNTVMFNLLFFVFGTIFSVAVAVMMNEARSRRFVKISQSVMFFPYFISWMVMGSIVYAVLNPETGLILPLVRTITGTNFDFFTSPSAWIPLLVIIHIWNSTGYTSIIYYGVLTGFDTSMYEAAQVDGASKWQQILKITLPLLRPTITIMFLLSVGNMLRGNLNMIIGLTNLNPILLPTTDLIDVFVYRSGVRNGEMAFASAVSLYQSIFGFLLVVISNKLAGLHDKESTLF